MYGTIFDMAGMEAAIYGRRSKDRDDEHKGLDAQINEVIRFSKFKGCIVQDKHIYIDDDASGATSNRKNLKAMLESAKRGEFRIVFVYMYDRFSRDPVFGINTVKELKAIGVTVISMHEGNSGDEDRDEETMMYAFVGAYAERARIRKRTGRGLKRNAEDGISTGGKPPLGYDYGKDKKLVINEHEASAVCLAFEWFAAGFPKKRIADELNQKGFRTKRNGLFKATSFDAIFKNTRYIGINKYGAMKALPKCPAIVDLGVFDRVQERLALSKQRTSGVGVNAKTKYPLSGKVTCKLCGARLYVDKSSNGKNAEYYTLHCPNRKKKTCSLKPVNMDKLTAFIMSQIRLSIADSADAIKANMAEVRHKLSAKEKKEREALNRGLGAVDREIEVLECRLSESDDEMVARFIRQIKAKEKQKKELLAELTAINEKEKPCNMSTKRLNSLIAATPGALFADGVTITSKKALDAVLEEITVSNDDVVLTLNLP